MARNKHWRIKNIRSSSSIFITTLFGYVLFSLYFSLSEALVCCFGTVNLQKVASESELGAEDIDLCAEHGTSCYTTGCNDNLCGVMNSDFCYKNPENQSVGWKGITCGGPPPPPDPDAEEDDDENEKDELLERGGASCTISANPKWACRLMIYDLVRVEDKDSDPGEFTMLPDVHKIRQTCFDLNSPEAEDVKLGCDFSRKIFYLNEKTRKTIYKDCYCTEDSCNKNLKQVCRATDPKIRKNIHLTCKKS